MKHWYVIFLLFLFSLSFTGMTVHAQDIEVGLFGGGSYYLGDMNPGKHFAKTQVAYGLLARYNIDTRWSVKLGLTRGTVKGDAASGSYLPERQLTFSSTVTDISAVTEFNFLPYFTGSRKNSISPYIFAGFSVFFFDPKANGVSLRSLGTEGQNEGYQDRRPYSSVSFSIPFGLGVKVSLAKRFGLQAFWEMHKTFTDYLDDASTTYYLDGHAIDPNNPAQFLSDPTMNHEPGMQRGNSRNQDWFSFFGVSLTYRFSLIGSKKCRDLEH